MRSLSSPGRCERGGRERETGEKGEEGKRKAGKVGGSKERRRGKGRGVIERRATVQGEAKRGERMGGEEGEG